MNGTTGKAKKDGKGKPSKENGKDIEADGFGSITTAGDLKTFLLTVRDKLTEEAAAPINTLSAINYVMNLGNIYEILDSENKELARDIWLRLKASGLQVRNPPLLFGTDSALDPA